jgi:hypothetical protein
MIRASRIDKKPRRIGSLEDASDHLHCLSSRNRRRLRAIPEFGFEPSREGWPQSQIEALSIDREKNQLRP